MMATQTSMKATAPSLPGAAPIRRTRAGDLCELVKIRLTFMVVITTMVGFYMGFTGSMDYVLLLDAILGTTLVACGAAALNQFLERRYDSLMRRTEDRPLPSGRMHPDTALIFGGVISIVGILYLALRVNLVTCVLGAITLCGYLFVYTPLKRLTPLNTAIGAIPGALPPLMGWTAARGEVTIEGWALFAILFFWQLPHFLAIAWTYREEYSRAGFVMLPSVDPDGQKTGWHAVSHTLGLVAVSLSPFAFRLSGPAYLAGAVVMGLFFLGAAIRFQRDLTVLRARQLFLVSILYLPSLLGLMVFDKLK